MAVDIAVLTVVRKTHHVVVNRDSDSVPALPGRFIRERHTVPQTIREVLELKLGLSPDHVHPTLLQVFDAPDRDARGWTISIAHSVALPADELEGVTGDLVPLTPDGRLMSGEALKYDHAQIIASAYDNLRRRYEETPDPDRLLRPPYTLSELRELHEAVLGRRLMRDTFNRRVKPLLAPQVDSAGKPHTRTAGGRPAALFGMPTEPKATFGYRLPGADNETG